MSGVLAIRELDDEDLPFAVGVVARGMRDNPLHVAVFGAEADRRAERLTRLFTIALPRMLSKGVVLGAFDGDTLAGIAGMIAPGQCRRSFRETLTLLPRLRPAVGGGAFTRMGRWTSAWARHDCRQPHWHLGPVAVDAHLQGIGIGGLLLTAFCARLDRERVAGYLETDKPANVTFYERFGFETVASTVVLNTPNWFMKRGAR
jgi:GNAT superfamily N-acetyltransferase